MGPQKVSKIQQAGNAQQGELAAQQLADSWLGDIKELLQLPGREFLLLNQVQDVLMQICLQLQLEPVLIAQAELIQDASPGSVDDQFAASCPCVALHVIS